MKKLLVGVMAVGMMIFAGTQVFAETGTSAVGTASSISIKGIVKSLEGTGGGVCLKNSGNPGNEKIVVSGFSVKRWFSSGLGLQIVYNSDGDEITEISDYTGHFSRNTRATDNSVVKTRVLRSLSEENSIVRPYVGLGYVSKKVENNSSNYSREEYGFIEETVVVETTSSYHSSLKEKGAEILLGVEYYPVKWVSFSGEISHVYMSSQKQENAWIPENDATTIEMIAHLYF